MKYHTLLFSKIEKLLQNLSSAAVVTRNQKFINCIQLSTKLTVIH